MQSQEDHRHFLDAIGIQSQLQQITRERIQKLRRILRNAMDQIQTPHKLLKQVAQLRAKAVRRAKSTLQKYTHASQCVPQEICRVIIAESSYEIEQTEDFQFQMQLVSEMQMRIKDRLDKLNIAAQMANQVYSEVKSQIDAELQIQLNASAEEPSEVIGNSLAERAESCGEVYITPSRRLLAPLTISMDVGEDEGYQIHCLDESFSREIHQNHDLKLHKSAESTRHRNLEVDNVLVIEKRKVKRKRPALASLPLNHSELLSSDKAAIKLLLNDENQATEIQRLQHADVSTNYSPLSFEEALQSGVVHSTNIMLNLENIYDIASLETCISSVKKILHACENLLSKEELFSAPVATLLSNLIRLICYLPCYSERWDILLAWTNQLLPRKLAWCLPAEFRDTRTNLLQLLDQACRREHISASIQLPSFQVVKNELLLNLDCVVPTIRPSMNELGLISLHFSTRD